MTCRCIGGNKLILIVVVIVVVIGIVLSQAMHCKTVIELRNMILLQPLYSRGKTWMEEKLGLRKTQSSSLAIINIDYVLICTPLDRIPVLEVVGK